MKVTICIGSSCHQKGAKQVLDTLQHLIKENNLKDKVELAGMFCMGECQDGVAIKIGENVYTVKPETTDEFFKKEIVGRL